MKKGATVKLIGVLATVAGAGLTLVSNWVSDKQMKDEVAKEVAKALTKQTIES